MKIRLLAASLFIKATAYVQKLLIASGVLPVNDIYLPIFDIKHKIVLLFGSYGSGKSVVIVDRLINKALENKFFRCYYGRKILEDVRGSVFKTITDRIKERNLKHKFSFSDAPNGTMAIVCKANGNEFLPFGASDSESLKSIKDPTDFFCEELNQFTFEDFKFIFTRLRKIGVDLQFWGAFNTDKVFQSHWIRKQLFDGEFADLAFKLFCNFEHNYFIDREGYLQQLKLASGGNAAVLNSIAYGAWGMVRTGDEFWKQFDETRHVRPVKIDPLTTIHVSVDNNVNPYVTQTLWQVFPGVKEVKQVHELLCASPDNNAPKAARVLAKWLRSINYTDVLFVHGDPSAKARSTVDENNLSFFAKYIAELRAEGFTVIDRVKKSAPLIAISAAFINEIYEHNYGGWSIIIGDTCFSSIEDYITVKEDVDGSMKKPKEKDKLTQVTYEPHGHISDTKRYFLCSILETDFIVYKSRRKRGGSLSGQRA